MILNLYYVDMDWGDSHTTYYIACENYSHAVQIIIHEIGDMEPPKALTIRHIGTWDSNASLLLSSEYDDILKPSVNTGPHT